ncbi:MAG: cupin domain-containing protein [Chloroflexota bacterium]
MNHHTAHINDVDWQADPRFPGVAVQVLISKTDTDAASLIHGRVEPGGEITTHTHETETEVVYVLAGSAAMTMGEDTFPLQAGASLLIPAGIPHSVKNDGDVDFEIIAVHTPPVR